MTPYELRFKIFEQANCLAQDKYHSSFARAEMLSKDDPNVEFPVFPTYEQIEELANKINNFVSSK
jgi:hypothetical protein